MDKTNLNTGAKLLSASPRDDHKGQCHRLCQRHHVLQGPRQYQLCPTSRQVEDPVKAVINVDDYSGSAQALAATTLRKVRWWW